MNHIFLTYYSLLFTIMNLLLTNYELHFVHDHQLSPIIGHLLLIIIYLLLPIINHWLANVTPSPATFPRGGNRLRETSGWTWSSRCAGHRLQCLGGGRQMVQGDPAGGGRWWQVVGEPLAYQGYLPCVTVFLRIDNRLCGISLNIFIFSMVDDWPYQLLMLRPHICKLYVVWVPALIPLLRSPIAMFSFGNTPLHDHDFLGLYKSPRIK